LNIAQCHIHEMEELLRTKIDAATESRIPLNK
jgi:hypothetical protein